MDRGIAKHFGFEQHGTTMQRELVAGITTFMTMSYIVVVNPAILSAAGIPVQASMMATIVTAVFGTLLMGLYANRPFAVAPYMGENAFIAYTVVLALGYSWQSALASVFLGGALFLVLTLLKLRQWFANAIPQTLRYSFAVGIGLFMTFIGLHTVGIVAVGVPGAPLRTGNLTSGPVLLAIATFLLMALMLIRKWHGAILLGILASTAIGMMAGIAPIPHRFVSAPPSLGPIFWEMDFSPVFSWSFFPVILTVFVMAFVDTMGTLIGVSARAGFLDEKGELPQMERPMLVDAVATMFAASVGTTTTGAFIESATGVEAGGRTGFTSVVTAACFALTLIFSPFAAAIPPQAYGPALIIVGLLMMAPVSRLRFDDITEAIPAFGVVALMSFTYNIGIGITAGLVLYPLCKLASGRAREVHPGLWALAGLSLLFFVFYPYGK